MLQCRLRLLSSFSRGFSRCNRSSESCVLGPASVPVASTPSVPPPAAGLSSSECRCILQACPSSVLASAAGLHVVVVLWCFEWSNGSAWLLLLSPLLWVNPASSLAVVTDPRGRLRSGCGPCRTHGTSLFSGANNPGSRSISIREHGSLALRASSSRLRFTTSVHEDMKHKQHTTKVRYTERGTMRSPRGLRLCLRLCL